MTKDEYVNWLGTRGPVGTWDLNQCRAADEFIKNTALTNAAQWSTQHVDSPARELLQDLLSAYFGSVEIDEFLQAINAYPDWIE